MRDKLLGYLLLTVVAAIIIGLVVLLGLAIKSGNDLDRMRREYADKNCTLVGYYGRSGQYRVFNCYGRVLREEDIFK